MKKWTGGVLIIGLGLILIIKYSYIERKPRKATAYEFFHPHLSDVSYEENNDANKPTELQTKLKKLQSAKRRKPHLINVRGIDDLFNFSNTPKEESGTLLAWSEMRPVLSRSDALPETALGIKEAAVAWKELLSTIWEERASKSINGSDKGDTREYKDCPYSVSSLNSTTAGSKNILDIPCGLVDDSSITIIATPDGQQSSFQIELIGLKLSEEPDLPIILHFNVILPGENFTKEPLIVQNTWTNESGWGKEERCPNHVSIDDIKVDGLVKCNAQLIRSSINLSNNKSTNISRGAHASGNFPFSEGSLFTATIWAGAEGFHMTVNGRHETSFAYREKLEPWFVAGVRVEGSLNLVSALAKGLPVSEDLDFVDVEHLKAPPISKKRVVMLVGVFSTGNNFERRMALRRSWMQYKAVRSGDAAVRFFIGLHKNRQVNYELWKEALAYGDIQLTPFVDYYSLISYKTIAICLMGTKILPAKYVMKTDDDAFIRIDEVLSSLKGKSSDGLLYGLISSQSEPQREVDNKWYISEEEWPHALYPPWAHGPGYVISRDIARFIVDGHQRRELQLFKLEDVAMGIWIEQFKKRGHKVHYVSDERFNNVGCESNYILAHYQSPRLVLCLWEKLQKEHEPNCCE